LRDAQGAEVAEAGLPDRLRRSEVAAGDEAVIPLAAETVHIEKQAVERGRVRVSTRTEIVEEVRRENLRADAVGVTRVPIDRIIAEGETAPQVRTEDGVTIIPVLEEILVVEKRLLLKEEVRIQRNTSGEDVEVPVSLRRQHAVIEREGPEDASLQPITPQPFEEK
jgi:uncharacterized protein (TIGR02271 family)